MKHLKDYLVLLSILVFAVFFFFYFNHNRLVQQGIIIATSAAYVLWGVVHHLLARDFHWRILVEYLVVAILAATTVVFLLMRA